MWNNYQSNTWQNPGQSFALGRVDRVITGRFYTGSKKKDPDYKGPADIGKIKFELLYSTLTIPDSEAVSRGAYPIYTFLKYYPVIGEVVMIVSGPGEGLNDKQSFQNLYYFPPFSTWNNPNHGAFPNLQKVAKYQNNLANDPDYAGKSTKIPAYPLGYTFKQKNVKNLEYFEGDLILQGRFGQSIRFGSTVPLLKSRNTWSQNGKNGDPITIILNEAGNRSGIKTFDSIVEDINKDGSAIYLTSSQTIALEDINDFPLKSFGNNPARIIQNTVSDPSLPLSTYSKSAKDQDSILSKN